MAAKGVVAVRPAIASLYLGQRRCRETVIESGVAVAVATISNRGRRPAFTSARAHPSLHLQRMTHRGVEGSNDYSARRCRLETEVGSLEPGKAADFAVLDAPDVNHWLYQLRPNACAVTVIGGLERWSAP